MLKSSAEPLGLTARLLDIIFPPRCEVCEVFLGTGGTGEGLGRSFCPSCLKSFISIGEAICPICGVPYASKCTDHYCETCLRRPPSYDCTRALFYYEAAVSGAVHAYKFDRRSRLAVTLGRAMGDHAAGWLCNSLEYLAVPVPLHPRRLAGRGFNQSALLASNVAVRTGMELDLFSLRRTRDTPAQSRLGKRARRRNVRGAFTAVDPEKFRGRSILLIDDVATTGSTLDECAGVLKKAGADLVLCLVFARTGIGLTRPPRQ